MGLGDISPLAPDIIIPVALPARVLTLDLPEPFLGAAPEILVHALAFGTGFFTRRRHAHPPLVNGFAVGGGLALRLFSSRSIAAWCC